MPPQLRPAAQGMPCPRTRTLRAARATAATSSPTPSAGQLQADVERLARVREAGRGRLRQLEEVRAEGTNWLWQYMHLHELVDAMCVEYHVKAAGGGAG